MAQRVCGSLIVDITAMSHMCMGHVLCKQCGCTAADFSPLHFSFFLLEVLLDLNKTKTKGKTKSLSTMFGVHGDFLHQ